MKRPKILTIWMSCYEETENCMKRYTSYWYPFGCRRIWELDFHTYSPWLRFGKLLVDGTWVFDKPAILRFVEEKMKEYRMCPNLDPGWPKKFLEVFPASVNPGLDKLWTYQLQEDLDRIRAPKIVFNFECEGNPGTIAGVGPKSEKEVSEIMNQLLALLLLKD